MVILFFYMAERGAPFLREGRYYRDALLIRRFNFHFNLLLGIKKLGQLASKLLFLLDVFVTTRNVITSEWRIIIDKVRVEDLLVSRCSAVVTSLN